MNRVLEPLRSVAVGDNGSVVMINYVGTISEGDSRGSVTYYMPMGYTGT